MEILYVKKSQNLIYGNSICQEISKFDIWKFIQSKYTKILTSLTFQSGFLYKTEPLPKAGPYLISADVS